MREPSAAATDAAGLQVRPSGDDQAAARLAPLSEVLPTAAKPSSAATTALKLRTLEGVARLHGIPCQAVMRRPDQPDGLSIARPGRSTRLRGSHSRSGRRRSAARWRRPGVGSTTRCHDAGGEWTRAREQRARRERRDEQRRGDEDPRDPRDDDPRPGEGCASAPSPWLRLHHGPCEPKGVEVDRPLRHVDGEGRREAGSRRPRAQSSSSSFRR